MTDPMTYKPSATNHPRDPFLADELDVLEAVWGIQKKIKKPLLTNSQLELLKRKRGVNVDEFLLKDRGEPINPGGVKKIGSLIPEGISLEQAKLLVAGLRAKIKYEIGQEVGDGGWDGFTENQKQYVISCYFRYVYGMAENQMALFLSGEDENGE